MVILDLFSLRSTIRYDDIRPVSNYILPTLSFRFIVSSRNTAGQQPSDVIITNISLEVYAVEQGTGATRIIGSAQARRLQERLTSTFDTSLDFHLTLDNLVLSEIERIRRNGGGNVYFTSNIRFQGYVVNQPGTMTEFSADVERIEISKSKWIEDILPQMNYKNIALLEVPKLEYKELNDVINVIDSAHKKFIMGDTNEVLRECRVALEGLATKVKEAGFEKEDTNDKGEKIKVPDWEKFFNDKDIGDIIKNIHKKTKGFVTPGAHWGNGTGSAEAHFALMETYAIAYYIISQFRRRNSGP
jgi:hypothetical protein